MRISLKFELTGGKQELPLNYQYPVSSWIYKVLESADESFSKQLHEEGYKLENGKTFKLFTFSRLNFPKNTWKTIPNSGKMKVWARKAYLTISFQLPAQVEKFVAGLFTDQNVFIGDKDSGLRMKVQNIEVLPNEYFDNQLNDDEPVTLKIRSLTGIVLGLEMPDKKYEQYVNPMHEQYKKLFLKNLTDKYIVAGIKDIDTKNLDFKILNLSPKTVMQTIKAGTSSETKVRAYNYEFDITAPKKVIEVGMNAGFGSMNSLGFGFCGVGNKNKNFEI